MLYQYTLLNQSKREIRLIILDEGPSSGTQAHLKCKLLPVSLDLYTRYQSSIGGDGDTIWQSIGRILTSKDKFPVPFFALSYVWGDPKPVCDIEIDGQATKISQNLADALLSIRNNTNFRVIWADALCINQADNVEKSWQVQQMAYLYARAKAVISWLGPPSDDSHLALKALEDLTQYLKSNHWKRNWSKEITSTSPKLHEVALALSRDTLRWTAIVALTARPYWTRVWIFQEMACSRQNLFLCGDFQAQDIKYPLFFLTWWGKRALVFSAPPPHPQCDAMIHTLYRYEHTLLGEAFFRYRPPRLANLLADLGVLDATDSRDRVYAVLSMAEDGRWSGIIPDYSKTEIVVLIETACGLLKLHWIDEIITCATTSDHPLGLPSWVPNWSARKKNAFHAGIYDACKGKEQNKSTITSIPSYGLHIKLDGYIVGMISTTAEPFWEFTFQRNGAAVSPSSSLKPWLQSIEVIVSQDKGGNVDQKSSLNRLGSSSDISNVMGRLLVADMIEHPTIKRLRSGASGFYDYIKGVDPLYIWHWHQLNPNPNPGKDFELGQYITSLLNIIFQNGIVFRTPSGDVGLTSNNLCRKGDIVVLFPGKRIPCVLRKVHEHGEEYPSEDEDGAYRLIGEAYMHGLMDGEFFERKCKAKRRTFTLE